MSPIIAVLIVLVVLALGYVMLNNNIIQLRNRIDNAWQTIDTQLQRRNDLIPNLIETVKGYAAHESGTLEAVVNARNSVLSAPSREAKMAAEGELAGALRQLFALAESYPDLKANTNFQQLQTDLGDTENRIAYARQSFNDCVLNYNNAIQTFPGSLIASIGGHTPMQGFVADDAARQVPEVKF